LLDEPKSATVLNQNQLNQKQLHKLARSLFPSPEDQELFCASILAPPSMTTALLHFSQNLALQLRSQEFPIQKLLPPWITLHPEPHELGKSQEHERGDFYCLDLSSALEVACLTQKSLQEYIPKAPRVLDLCSSPGGKAIFASRALVPRFLCCNEVSQKRHASLTVNLERCKIPNAVVTNHDPQHFAKALPCAFDIILVDAPCSGQSLAVKGTPAQGAFHEQTQRKNAMRQRRILSNALACLAPGGILLYSTCTFSRLENEDNVQWLLKKNKHIEALCVSEYGHMQSAHAELPCYRFYPQYGQGAGGFVALFRSLQSSWIGEEHEPDFSEVLRVQWKSPL
jgi:16S rRNA C967 or C1407 C5-methylase (RsmB/RsmF family)